MGARERWAAWDARNPRGARSARTKGLPGGRQQNPVTGAVTSYTPPGGTKPHGRQNVSTRGVKEVQLAGGGLLGGGGRKPKVKQPKKPQVDRPRGPAGGIRKRSGRWRR